MADTGGSRTGFIYANGARLYYKQVGNGYPLLLLHAGVADNGMWDDQFYAFSRHHCVTGYDMRGFGKNEPGEGRYSAHDDVAGVMGFLEVEKAFVVGASFGGGVALDFALAYPDMVGALVLCAPAVSGYEPSSVDVLEYIATEDELLERGDIEAATELNLRTWVDGPHRTPGDVNPQVRKRVREMQLRAFTLSLQDNPKRQPLAPPAITRLAEIHVPVLVITGDLDVPEFLKLSDTVVEGITGAKKAVVKGTAHLPNMEKPDEFNRIVLDFLGGI